MASLFHFTWLHHVPPSLSLNVTVIFLWLPALSVQPQDHVWCCQPLDLYAIDPTIHASPYCHLSGDSDEKARDWDGRWNMPWNVWLRSGARRDTRLRKGQKACEGCWLRQRKRAQQAGGRNTNNVRYTDIPSCRQKVARIWNDFWWVKEVPKQAWLWTSKDKNHDYIRNIQL